MGKKGWTPTSNPSRVSVDFDSVTRERLRIVEKQQGMTPAALVHLLVNDWLDRHGPPLVLDHSGKLDSRQETALNEYGDTAQRRFGSPVALPSLRPV